MIYLDSCALVKLVRAEEHSQALQDWLDERPDELHVTSTLARAELVRAIRRNNHTRTGEVIDAEALDAELAEATEVLGAVTQLAVDEPVLDRAGAYTEPTLRTLDAIHLSSASEFDPEDVVFVTYDQRLAAAATAAELAVVAPIDEERTGEQPTSS